MKTDKKNKSHIWNKISSKRKARIENRRKVNPSSFDVNNKALERLKFIIIIVKRGHGVATNQILLENGVSASTLLFAEGTATKYVTDILIGEEQNKDAIFALVPESKYIMIRNAVEARFKISAASRGILLTIDVDSIAGVLAYKYLTDYGGAAKYGKQK